MTFAIRLVFGGRFCRPTFETSVAEAAASHPLLTSCVHSSNNSLSVFEAAPNDLMWVDSNLAPVISELPLTDAGMPPGLNSQSDRIDVSRENGFKTFVSEQYEKTDVHFLFHHAACDGIGGFKFVEEVLARYHAAETQTDFLIPVVDPDLLKLRDANCEAPLPWHRRMLRSSFVLPRRILGMTRPALAKIATPAPTPDSVSGQPVSAVLEMPTLTLERRRNRRHQSP